MRDTILHGDALARLRELPAESVQCVITSPPYFGLRDYGVAGQIGLEETPEAYVATLVAVFREVKRVLRKDGVCWVNLGDSYAASGGHASYGKTSMIHSQEQQEARNFRATKVPGGSCAKQLLGMPWRVAFALQADGWILRSDVIWAKPNCMPESVRDRPTKSHEYLFLFAKSERYFYDAIAVREGEQVYTRKGTQSGHHLTQMAGYKGIAGGTLKRDPNEAYGFARDITTVGRNKRTVWTIATQPYKQAHFAVMPPALVEPCVLAGSKPGDLVLDPFMGAGTVGLVAKQHNRHYLGIELNAAYIALAEKRIADAMKPRAKILHMKRPLPDDMEQLSLFA